jgi:hypothetical protein
MKNRHYFDFWTTPTRSPNSRDEQGLTAEKWYN